MQNFKKIIFLLSSRERKLSVILFFLLLIMALLEMIGVASILPFIAVLSNPELIETNKILNFFYKNSKIIGVNNNQEFLFTLGIMVFLLLIFSLSFRALTTYAAYKFVQMREFSISRRLVITYLRQPYEWFLNRNSSELGKSVLSEVGEVVGMGLKPMIDLVARILIAIAILSLLIVVDPKLAFIVGLTIGAAYGIIYKFAKNYLQKIGSERLKNNELRYSTVMEAFGAAKEIKLTGLENAYIQKYTEPANKYAKSQALQVVISDLPRYALEAVAFGGILLIIVYLISQNGSFNSALPIISLYVFAGYRLMPAIQRIYSNYSKITYITPALDKLYQDIKSLDVKKISENQNILDLKNNIILKNVSFIYPKSSRKALNNINLSIPFKSRIGLIDTTGCGKTTLVDIILGLLKPTEGKLEIDGKDILNEISLRKWQRALGYVPQNIYLADDTIAANIAFGLDKNKVDQSKVEAVSKIANLHNFVANELPEKYQTFVGERGVRLSGGQLQRIGIARALYNNPSVLILDEATSALDLETEKAVMDAINNLNKNVTIVIIAHRLNTVKNCDMIFKFEKGELVSKGTYQEIIAKM